MLEHVGRGLTIDFVLSGRVATGGGASSSSSSEAWVACSTFCYQSKKGPSVKEAGRSTNCQDLATIKFKSWLLLS